MRRVTLAVFNSREEAEGVREFLQSAGLGGEVCVDSDVEEMMQFARPRGGYRVEVGREDFEEALYLLRDWNGSETSGEAGFPWLRRRPDVGGTAGSER